MTRPFASPEDFEQAQLIEGWEIYNTCLPRATLDALLQQFSHGILFDHVPENPRSRHLIFSAAGTPVSLEQAQAYQVQQRLPSALADLPFCAGFAGYLSYDYGEQHLLRSHEQPQISSQKQAKALADKKPQAAPKPGLPDYAICYYPWAYIEEHLEQDDDASKGKQAPTSATLVFSPRCSTGLKTEVISAIKASLVEFEASTTDAADTKAANLNGPLAPSKLLADWQKDQSRADYQAAFAQVIDYILAGDIYQANLTQRYSMRLDANQASSWQLYNSLRKQSNGHYGGFIKLSEQQSLLSFSPEQFISIKGSKVVTKPIKGTSEITSDPEAEILKNSVKDRAENLMIVDLMRNDLSRVCKAHSVNTTKLFDIEHYRKLNHMVSTVEGELAEQYSALDAFLACFPGGSITGAPKIRAMEVIKELEKQPRSAYCGSMFYLSEHGHFDSNILIRSIVHDGDDYYCWSGGGIVADSKEPSEYQESLNKVKHLTGIEV